MRLFCVLFLALVGRVAAAEPLFYVLDVRHTGDAILHASSRSVAPKAPLAYVLVDSPAMECCFHIGLKPGQRKSTAKIDEDAPRLTSEEGDETFQRSGYVVQPPRGATGAMDKLAFGVEDMTSVRVKNKRTYEIVFGKAAKSVIVKHCLGAEGVNFRLYHSIADRAPYASYYFALGYDTAPDC
ncbi:MAG: hypothetical protein ACRYF7_23600 [Janthinobacterium lividum]